MNAHGDVGVDPLHRLDDALEKMSTAIADLREVVTEMQEDGGSEEGSDGPNTGGTA